MHHNVSTRQKVVHPLGVEGQHPGLEEGTMISR